MVPFDVSRESAVELRGDAPLAYLFQGILAVQLGEMTPGGLPAEGINGTFICGAPGRVGTRNDTDCDAECKRRAEIPQ